MRNITFTDARPLRAGILAAALGLLAACAPVPTTDTSCDRPEACLFVSFAAKALQPDIGMDFGGGVTLRGVQAAGQVLVIDTVLPQTKAQFAKPGGQATLDVFTAAFATGFCSERQAQAVFDAGAIVRLRAFSTDNAPLGDTTLRSCRGV